MTVQTCVFSRTPPLLLTFHLLKVAVNDVLCPRVNEEDDYDSDDNLYVVNL